MKYVELVVVLGGQFVSTGVNADDMEKINKDLLDAMKWKSTFTIEGRLFAKGEAMTGWYYREIKTSPSEAAAKAINRLAEGIEKDANDQSDGWKNG